MTPTLHPCAAGTHTHTYIHTHFEFKTLRAHDVAGQQGRRVCICMHARTHTHTHTHTRDSTCAGTRESAGMRESAGERESASAPASETLRSRSWSVVASYSSTISTPISSHVVCTFLRPPAMIAVDLPPGRYCKPAAAWHGSAEHERHIGKNTARAASPQCCAMTVTVRPHRLNAHSVRGCRFRRRPAPSPRNRARGGGAPRRLHATERGGGGDLLARATASTAHPGASPSIACRTFARPRRNARAVLRAGRCFALAPCSLR